SLLTGYPSTGVEHQRRVCFPDHLRQCSGEPEPWVKTKSGEICTKARLWTAHAQVRDQRKPKATANRGAMNRSDDGFTVSKQAHGLRVKVRNRLPLFARAPAIVVERAAIAEIRPGAECLALRSQH